MENLSQQKTKALFEPNQDRIDLFLRWKMQQINEYGKKSEWIELSSLLEHCCGFTKFDSHRVAADEIIRRFQRRSVMKVFICLTPDILNSIDPQKAARSCLDAEKLQEDDCEYNGDGNIECAS